MYYYYYIKYIYNIYMYYMVRLRTLGLAVHSEHGRSQGPGDALGGLFFPCAVRGALLWLLAPVMHGLEESPHGHIRELLPQPTMVGELVYLLGPMVCRERGHDGPSPTTWSWKRQLVGCGDGSGTDLRLGFACSAILQRQGLNPLRLLHQFHH